MTASPPASPARYPSPVEIREKPLATSVGNWPPPGKPLSPWLLRPLKVLGIILLLCAGLVELKIYQYFIMDESPDCKPTVLCEALSPTGMFRAVAKDYQCESMVVGENVYIENLRVKSDPVWVGRISREKSSRPAHIDLHWTSKNTLVVGYTGGTKDFEHKNVIVGLERAIVSFVPVAVDEAGTTVDPAQQ